MMPPPAPVAVLSRIALSVTVNTEGVVPSTQMPPPSDAALFETVVLVIVRAESVPIAIPPPM